MARDGGPPPWKRRLTMSEANYHEFLDLPAYTAAQWSEKNKVNGERALLNPDDPYKWSGDKAPPAIGAKVRVYMNSFGNGTVIGYFAEYGWLGVLVKISKPPKWWVKQIKERGLDPKATPGHFFGIDLQSRKVVTK
jgi:hypothetical protein